GLQPDSPQRLKAGIYYALEQAADEGHCHLNQATLAQRARALLGIGDELDLEPHLESLISENFIVRELEMLSLTQLYRAERFVAQFTAQRIAAEPHPIIEEQIIERCVAQAAQDLGLEFSPEQLRAVQYATHHPFLIITGGPGCGKTTLIRALSAVYDRANRRVLLAAPTGRAAQRMSQVCGMPAGTIHRLLRYDPHKHKFLHDSHNPLPGDVLIIDEASMLDINLARDLFAAIPGNCVLILVGDKDQLPSVGPGRVFADLLAVREVKSVALSHLFRRSEESSINSVAHMINSGITPEIPAPDGNTKTDAYFLPKTSADEAANLIESLVADQLPRKFGFELDDITVLTPSNRGPLGTNELNKRLQKRLNPENNALTQNQIMHGETCFRVGDRVCQRVNNYNLHEAGVFNGDNGIIYRVDPQNRKLLVELWDGRLIEYESGDISQLSLAYAVSVHRSQGSEIPCVVLALHESQYNLLERQLLYTGVTRAKKLLVVVGSKRALNIASRRTSSKQRCTYLRERIKEYLSNA
ncbi:MAG: AAA family ATPase, partial [Bdellovibrionales bacterium]|nr:AAA family ATPase [Bdellovibrionales bacterium]